MSHQLPKRIAANIGRFTGRTWIIPRILNWWDERPEERVLLLTGRPGVGKSMVAAWLANGDTHATGEEQAQFKRIYDAVKAVYFCQAASRNVSPSAFAKDVAEQLTASVPDFGDALAASLSDVVKIEGTASADSVTGGVLAGVAIEKIDLAGLTDELSFDRSFSEPLKKLYATGHAKPMLLLIDALDEAQTYSGITIPRLLSTLSDLPPQVRMVITTRDDPRVLKLYRDAPRLDLVDDAPSITDDIHAYALQRLEAISLDKATAAKFATRLAEAADGVFLYAAIVLEQLADMPPETAPDLRHYALPSGLSGLYRDFLNRELGGNEEFWSSTYEPLLGLIAVGQGDGLGTEQLAAMIGKDVRPSLRTCKQYLSGDLPDGPFRVFHQSFVDFLFDKRNEDFYIAAKSMHERIINYLASKGRQFLSDKIDSNDAGSDAFNVPHPDQSYYFGYFPYHLASANERDVLKKLLLDYRWLSRKLAHTDIHALYSDYALEKDEPALNLVGRVLGLAGPTLAADPRQLAGQLLGRLASTDAVGIDRLLKVARDLAPGPSLIPKAPTLIPPGAQLRRIDHAGSLEGLVVLADNRRGLACSSYSIDLLDFESGFRIRRFALGDSITQMSACALTVDERHVLAAYGGSGRCEFILWDIETGKEARRYEAEGYRIVDLAVFPDGRRVLSTHSSFQEGVLKVWDLTDGAVLRTIPFSGSVTSLALTKSGDCFLVGYQSGLIQLWDVATGALVRDVQLQAKEVRHLTWLPDARRALVYSGGLVLLLDVETGLEVHRYVNRLDWSGQLGAMTSSANGRSVFADLDSYYAGVWDTESAKEQKKLGPHDLAVCAIAVSPDGRRAISGCLGDVLRIWDLERAPSLRRSRNATDESYHLTMMPDHQHLCSVQEKDRHSYFRLRNRNLTAVRRIKIADTAIRKFAVTPNGRAALAVHGLTNLRLWCLETGRKICELANDYNEISAIAISPDGRTAVSGHWYRPPRKPTFHHSRDGEFGDDFPDRPRKNVALMKRWDLSLGQQIQDYRGDDMGVWKLAFVPDGTILVASSNALELRNLDSGEVLRTFETGYLGMIHTLSITSQGLVVAGTDKNSRGILRLWDFKTGREIGLCEGHRGNITDLSVFRDGSYAASSSDDRSVRIWDLANKKEKARFDFDTGVSFCRFIGDESHLAIRDNNGQLHLLQLKL